MIKKLNIGIIACSNVADKRFLPALKQSKLANLYMIGSRNISKAKKFAEKYKCLRFGNYDDVLNNKEIDIVYISTPITLKDKLFKKAIKQKKHILSEKPAFMNLQQTNSILNLCKINRINFFEGWMFKYHPQHILVKELLKKNEIGNLRYFDSKFTYPQPKGKNIRLDNTLGGGIFYDSIGYPISASRMFIKHDIKSLNCVKRLNSKFHVEDFVLIHMEFDRNIHASLCAGFGMCYQSKYSLLGTKGMIEVKKAFSVNEKEKTILVLENNKKRKEFYVPPVNQFTLMIDNFCEKIFNKNYYKKNEMIDYQKILDASILSASKNKKINFY